MKNLILVLRNAGDLVENVIALTVTIIRYGEKLTAIYIQMRQAELIRG